MGIVGRACDHLESLVIVPNSVYGAISVALEMIIKGDQHQSIGVIIVVNGISSCLERIFMWSSYAVDNYANMNVAIVCDLDFYTYIYCLHSRYIPRYRKMYFEQKGASAKCIYQ